MDSLPTKRKVLWGGFSGVCYIQIPAASSRFFQDLYQSDTEPTVFRSSTSHAEVVALGVVWALRVALRVGGDPVPAADACYKARCDLLEGLAVITGRCFGCCMLMFRFLAIQKASVMCEIGHRFGVCLLFFWGGCPPMCHLVRRNHDEIQWELKNAANSTKQV